MFFLFHGDDTAKARSVAQKNINAAKKKHADAGFFKLNSENFSLDKLDELIASQGLFYSAFIIFSDCLCENKDNVEILNKKIKDIAESPNFFVFLEKKLLKKELDLFKKYAGKVEEFKKPPVGEGKKLSKKEALALKGEKIDFFEFANTLGERNKKLLWTLYQDALHEGVPSEEVHGIFFWQIKVMLASINSTTATEADLNPFVFNKSKTYAKNYTPEKLKEMSNQLFNMYHQAHRGETDFAIALETFILKI